MSCRLKEQAATPRVYTHGVFVCYNAAPIGLCVPLVPSQIVGMQVPLQGFAALIALCIVGILAAAGRSAGNSCINNMEMRHRGGCSTCRDESPAF